MTVAGGIAAASSLASVGFQTSADMNKLEGQASAYSWQSHTSLENAQFEKLRAKEAEDIGFRQAAVNIGDFDARSAAMNLDPTSPTQGAIRSGIRTTDMQNVERQVYGIQKQAQMDQEAALYYSQMAQFTENQKGLVAGADILKGIAPMFGSIPGLNFKII